MLSLVIAALGLVVAGVLGDGASHWTYSDQNSWGGICNNGEKQSPIDIVPADAYVQHFDGLYPLYFNTTPSTMTLSNNGHTVKLTVETTCELLIVGGGLPGMYHFDQLHFHWGSEHTINEIRYPLEMHLVHHSTKYDSLKNALGMQAGIAVLSVLFEESSTPNPKLNGITSQLDQVRQVNSSVSIPPFPLSNLFPEDIMKFYRYEGSLTTPDCSEGVIWTIFISHVPVSKEQIELFKGIQSDEGSDLLVNHRDIQPMNKRYLYKRTPDTHGPASCSSTLLLSPLVLLAAIFVYC